MSFFSVTIEEIETISPIEGADRIQVATLKGVAFSFVVGKDIFKTGEKILYFPVDSLIPQALAEKLGVAGKLSGRDKNRVKTVKLRGTVSQGLVGKLSLIDGLTDQSPESITQFLGVTKYEPSEILEKGANLTSLPVGLSKYDIEGIERHSNVVEYMMDKKVRIDEKVEGQNVSFTLENATKKFYVNQRNHTIEPIDGSRHTWWKYADENKLESVLNILGNRFNNDVTLYSEGTGSSIQGNIYGFVKHQVFFYDIKVGQKFLNTKEALAIFNEFNLPIVPTLALDVTLHEWLEGKTITEASDGPSKLYVGNREGIVIRLMEEEEIYRFGRSIIKKRGPIYLSKTDN
jgi:RNA ligase (TIGR02306 family)